MRLSAEKHHLLRKGLKAALRPGEVFGSAVAGSLVFALVYYSCCSGVRYTSPGVSAIGVLLPLGATIGATVAGASRYHARRPSRAWIANAFLMWCCFLPAYSMGDRYWWRSMVNYYTWRDMASYVNIDPELDRGQSYMDAGTVYFKEGSYVMRNRSVAFHNGVTYCVAPIMRNASLDDTAIADQLPVLNGFTVPRSGTVDFWAVGTDCCGSGEFFDCGDVSSFMSRSGLRVLDARSRSMYVLGVQEWSATTGLPVRHPLFFTWVRDPIVHAESLQDKCLTDFVVRSVTCCLMCFVVSYMVHNLLHKVHVT